MSLSLSILLSVALRGESQPQIMAGEPDDKSLVFQARFEEPVWARFVSDDIGSPWMKASDRNGFVVKSRLSSNRVKLEWLDESGQLHESREHGPYSLAKPDSSSDVSIAVINGMNYHRFFDGPKAYKGRDRSQGYPALEAIARQEPNFLAFMGDNVYYDHPSSSPAKTREELRDKWKEQFELPRLSSLLQQIPAFWIKDDHDFRFNDSDLTGQRPPLSDLGIEVFREQVPILGQGESGPTYRTRRLSNNLQIWLIEGRDYRSPNSMTDGPDKTLWGSDQRRWLRETLKSSDARWKIILSPTPMVGPDDAYKKDNHANIGGFNHEGEEFFSWLVDQGLTDEVLLVCGDRHWQYHSIHPKGIREFSAGALIDAAISWSRQWTRAADWS